MISWPTSLNGAAFAASVLPWIWPYDLGCGRDAPLHGRDRVDSPGDRFGGDGGDLPLDHYVADHRRRRTRLQSMSRRPTSLPETALPTGVRIFIVGQRDRLLLFDPVGGIGFYREKVAQGTRLSARAAVAVSWFDHGYPSLPANE